MTTAAAYTATRDAAVVAANKTLATSLESLNAQIATANRTQESAIKAAEAALLAGLKSNADSIATDFLAVTADDTTPYGCVIQWRSDSARSHITALVTLLQGFATRSQNDLGQGLRNTLPALLFAKVLVAGNANYRSVFGQRDFFLGNYLQQDVGESAGALIAAKSTLVAEVALKRLELALVQRIDQNTVGAPSADQISIYNAQLASGRESDFVDRLKALGL